MRTVLRVLVARPDVVVVGAGPTGLTLGLLLGRLGVSVLLLERRAALPDHPQAHFVNHRTMEIFRPLNNLAAEITHLTPPLSEWRRFVYCETLGGGVFGRVDHFKGQRSRLTPLSPEPVAHLSQNRLLPLLLKRLNRLPNVRLKFSAQAMRCETTPVGVDVEYTSQARRHAVQSRFAVVADGANSDLVDQIWPSFTGTGAIQNLLSVHFRSMRLSAMLSENPAMLYFVFNPDVVLVVVAHHLSDGEFVAQIPFFPPLQRPSDFAHARCADLIRAAAGDDLPDIKIASVRPWVMKQRVAASYQSGNIFIAGDAAHVFPPAGGFGMNTGIQDAHNLAWRLAAVVRGLAGKELLLPYSSERRSVALRNARLSVENWREAVDVASALGLDPRHATLLNNVVSVGLAKFVPNAVAKAVLEGALDLGRRLSGFRGPFKLWRQRRVKEVFASGLSLRLQFPKEDLGFVYPYGSSDTTLTQTGTSRTTLFVPRIVVGARLPHAWLTFPASQLTVSTLDLVSWSELKCTLFCIGFDKEKCLEVLKSLPRVALTAIVVQDGPSRSTSEDEAYRPFRSREEICEADTVLLSSGISVFVASETRQSLRRCLGAPPRALVVVRSDGHVASVVKSLNAATLQEAVGNVFSPDCPLFT